MPADSLTTRRANRHVCCPLIFIELLLEQLFSNRHDVTSREEPTVTPSCRLETCSARHRRIFRMAPGAGARWRVIAWPRGRAA